MSISLKALYDQVQNLSTGSSLKDVVIFDNVTQFTSTINKTITVPKNTQFFIFNFTSYDNKAEKTFKPLIVCKAYLDKLGTLRVSDANSEDQHIVIKRNSDTSYNITSDCYGGNSTVHVKNFHAITNLISYRIKGWVM